MSKKKPAPYRMERFGVLNPYGDVWSPETFDTPEEAERHVREFWKDQKGKDLSIFKIVPVGVTVVARSTDGAPVSSATPPAPRLAGEE